MADSGEHKHDHHEESGLLESIMGEHFHHGFYDPWEISALSDHRAAQVRMMEEMLRFAGISDDAGNVPKRIVDVGCGVGGSSRYLAKKFNAQVEGFTLSPVQIAKANHLTQAEGLTDKVHFQVADALEQPFPDGHFDLVWSLQSAEHIPNKPKLMSELARVAAPGGTIIIAVWCHRDLLPGENSLRPEEMKIMDMVMKASDLPPWCSPSEYVSLAESAGLEDIKMADWSDNVAPFWPAILSSIFTEEGLKALLHEGPQAIKKVQQMTLLTDPIANKLIRLAVISCRKP